MHRSPAGSPERRRAACVCTRMRKKCVLRAAMPHKPLSQFSILSSAAGSAQIAVSSQSGDCSVTDEFQSTHLRLTRLVNSELTAACHATSTTGPPPSSAQLGLTPSQCWWPVGAPKLAWQRPLPIGRSVSGICGMPIRMIVERLTICSSAAHSVF